VVHAVTGLLEASPEALVALGHRLEWVAEETLSAGAALNTDNQESAQGSTSWWHNNFFRACDSLDSGGGEDDQLQRGLKQCMKIQQALVRQAIAIIEKQVIITLSTCRVATLKDGPNLSIFWDPLTLGKLAQFLVHAIRVSFLMLLKVLKRKQVVVG
jgi:cell division control protein 45